jgi:hypothetical protein
MRTILGIHEDLTGLLVQCLAPKFCELLWEKNIEICALLRFYPA